MVCSSVVIEPAPRYPVTMAMDQTPLVTLQLLKVVQEYDGDSNCKNFIRQVDDMMAAFNVGNSQAATIARLKFKPDSTIDIWYRLAVEKDSLNNKDIWNPVEGVPGRPAVTAIAAGVDNNFPEGRAAAPAVVEVVARPGGLKAAIKANFSIEETQDEIFKEHFKLQKQPAGEPVKKWSEKLELATWKKTKMVKKMAGTPVQDAQKAEVEIAINQELLALLWVGIRDEYRGWLEPKNVNNELTLQMFRKECKAFEETTKGKAFLALGKVTVPARPTPQVIQVAAVGSPSQAEKAGKACDYCGIEGHGAPFFPENPCEKKKAIIAKAMKDNKMTMEQAIVAAGTKIEGYPLKPMPKADKKFKKKKKSPAGVSIVSQPPPPPTPNQAQHQAQGQVGQVQTSGLPQVFPPFFPGAQGQQVATVNYGGAHMGAHFNPAWQPSYNSSYSPAYPALMAQGYQPHPADFSPPHNE